MLEDYLCEEKTPMYALDTLLEIMNYQADEDEIFSGMYEREYAQKHMALLFSVQLIVKHLIKQRNIYYGKMLAKNYPQ